MTKQISSILCFLAFMVVCLPDSIAHTPNEKSYEDCILNSLQGVDNVNAVNLIEKACKSKFEEEVEASRSAYKKLKEDYEILLQKWVDLKAVNKLYEEELASQSENSQPSSESLYWEFPGTFTTELKNSRKFIQVGIAIESDAKTISAAEAHQLALRSSFLKVMGGLDEKNIAGTAGREVLSLLLLTAANVTLGKLEECAVVSRVHLTSFIVQ